MPPPWRRRLTVVAGAGLALVLVAAVAVVGWRWWQDRHRTDLERAVAYAPADTARFSWTDWAAVRGELGADLDDRSSAEDVEEFLSDGLRRRPHLGVRDGRVGHRAAAGLRLLPRRRRLGAARRRAPRARSCSSGCPTALDVDELADGFEALGLPTRPTRTRASGTAGSSSWPSSAEQNGSSLSPQFQYLALDADRHLLLASDSGPYLRDAVAGLDDDLDDEGLSDVIGAVGEPLSAAVYTGDNACKALAMAQADEGDQSSADQLVAAAGGVDPLTGFAMAAEPDGTVRVAHGVRERRPGATQRRQPGRAGRGTGARARAATSPTGSTSVRSPPTAGS